MKKRISFFSAICSKPFIGTAVFFIGLIVPCFAEEEWQRVYLATYPRSGNHWIRYLIEEATGIATSSVYSHPDAAKDKPHLATPFPWGGYCCDHGHEGNRRYPGKDEIVVLKTHFPQLKSKWDHAPQVKTIRIVRNPIDSFYSYYEFSHSPIALLPSAYIKICASNWRKFHEYYNNKPHVVTFFYEDLLHDPCKMLSEILKAIGYSDHKEDVERAVAKYPPFGKMLKHRSKYRKEDLIFLASELKDLLQQYGYTIPILE